MWMCECDCEQKIRKPISGRNLRRESTVSCGCLNRKIKHGMSHTAPHWAWASMKDRCYNENNPAYKHYGGRGIEVCEEWRNDFPTFYRDMYPKPSEELSLDRIDVNGNYCKDNCQWATDEEQANNVRRNIVFEHDGEKLTINQWARKINIDMHCLYDRYIRGWDVERILTTPSDKRKETFITFKGKTQNLSEWSRETGINRKVIKKRIENGMSIEEAFTKPMQDNGRRKQ